jgi:hypothetical protein
VPAAVSEERSARCFPSGLDQRRHRVVEMHHDLAPLPPGACESGIERLGLGQVLCDLPHQGALGVIEGRDVLAPDPWVGEPRRPPGQQQATFGLPAQVR